MIMNTLIGDIENSDFNIDLADPTADIMYFTTLEYDDDTGQRFRGSTANMAGKAMLSMVDKDTYSITWKNCLEIGGNAFEYCCFLNQVSFPNCRVINTGAFSNMASTRRYDHYNYSTNEFESYYITSDPTLSILNFPNCIYVGANAFHTPISQISFPNCIMIGRNAFRGAYYKSSSISFISEINLPKCEYIGQSAFQVNLSGSLFSLPKCKYIGQSAFFKRISITQSIINLPKCHYIGSSAFYYANQSVSTTLTMVLPKCSYIGSQAFAYANISSFYLLNSQVCQLQEAAFYNMKTTFRVYVPADLLSSYKQDTNWISISNRILAV